MEENKEEKTVENKATFFKKVYYSITKFDKYPEMAVDGVGKAIIYLLKIMIIFSIILCIGLIYSSYVEINKVARYLENEFPDLTYQNGILNVNSEEAITIETNSFIIDKIIFDTKIEDEESINKHINSIDSNSTGIIFLKDRVILRNSGISGNYKYEEILNSMANNKTMEDFTKQDIIDYITGDEMPSIYTTLFVVLLIYTISIYFISTIIDALIISLFGWCTTIFARIKLTYSLIFNMSIYSLTLSIILNIIYMIIRLFTDFEITYFQVMYTAVAYIYLATAIFMIKADLIKRQMEVQQIIKVQEKVKKEQEEKKEDETEDVDKQDEENKDTKGEGEDNNIGDEPESSNA